ncbi:diaminobutyrate--2-oxoglutarate transaminase [Thermomonospora catenispora]|mgnify:CR=1 FL=1|uniref:diaminobutyrate--2-oxoglutarate transaminase n=1 Tax=Thermomonospora catenispora TaxID=2493090 RepID=UPI0011236770|nr:diaminobutyrate--2-oxoglutarate transaminase [Thermomonospora catenispora]TNY38144.1 diaminobutyrate--2-oxoglutarate transaminase [Thermomonospora catenispora]
MHVFERLESQVRSYCRGWPTVFRTAQGSTVTDESGRVYLDFFAGAGSLNYGHNNPLLKQRLLRYLADDFIVHSLDAHTVAKREFLQAFHDIVLAPRGLDYKIQFPGPTGTNAVEAALKLARKYTGRETVVSFTNAFHGMTLGSLAVSGNSMKRGGAGVPLNHTSTMPYDNYLDGRTPDFLLFERMLADSGSGLDKPAAVIVETVQGEGGLNAARPEWLRGLADLCRRHDILLIVDDVQMGCGRTGPFFSFEDAGIVPDIVCLSKSLSGYGLPLAVTLLRPELDVWEPGEHNGTFRGFNPAFVTATAALEYWTDDRLQQETRAKGELIRRALTGLVDGLGDAVTGLRGRGMAQGIAFADPRAAGRVCAQAFRRGLLMETSGPEGEVAKLLPPLTITERELTDGLQILAESVTAALELQPA